MRFFGLALGLLLCVTGQASAQSIERACLHSDRDAKNRALCGCIQQAADLMLSANDQKLAATFYRDPDKAQEIRQSRRLNSEKFWDRYKEYAATAVKYCS